jgi:hypothetical protein
MGLQLVTIWPGKIKMGLQLVTIWPGKIKMGLQLVTSTRNFNL